MEFFVNVATLHSLSLTAIALYLTVLSGYLVVAYAVGADLDNSQVIFINSIFLIFSTVLALFSFIYIFGSFNAGVTVNGGPPNYLYYILYLFLAAQLFAIFGAVNFMANVRKKSKQ
jgi:hypothetical protein